MDTFSVTSTSSRVYYKLCGTLTGQHSEYIIVGIFFLGVKKKASKSSEDYIFSTLYFFK